MPIVIGGLILAFMVMLLFGGTELDRGLLFLFSAPDLPRLEQAAALVRSALGPVPLVAITGAAAGYMFVRGRRREALLLLAVSLLGRLLVEAAQSFATGFRPGPDERMNVAQAPFYPAGDVANLTLTGFALAFLASGGGRTRSFALSAASTVSLLLGAAILLLGAAWPSDVIGGWALGLAWTLLFLKLARTELGDGTARPLRHSPAQGETYEREPQDRDSPRE